MSEEQKKEEWCNHCIFNNDCEDSDEFLNSNEENCEWYA